MVGLTVCRVHGGYMIKAMRGLRKRRRVRHHGWTEGKRTSDLDKRT
jgi:hypothetical protein